jgi:hypothetical protein
VHLHSNIAQLLGEWEGLALRQELWFHASVLLLSATPTCLCFTQQNRGSVHTSSFWQEPAFSVAHSLPSAGCSY